METKKCPHCGKTVLALSKVCKYCGKSFETTNENVTTETPKATPQSSVERQQASVYQEKTQPAHAQTSMPTESKPFPWLILGIALVLLLGIGGGVGYFNFYVPYKIDKEAPRYYTFAANTFLRSSQVSGVEHNILAKVPYGSELIVYDNSSDWSKVKWDGKKGYMSTPFTLPKQDFYLLNSIFGDNDAKEVINTAKCRIALLNYFKSRGYYGVIEPQLAKSVFGTESFPVDRAWQVFSKHKNSKYNSTYYKRITNKDSKFTDFAVLITNIGTRQRKCLLFSFSDDAEMPQLEYEEEAPHTGDIVSITGRKTVWDNVLNYYIEYR